MSVIAERTKYVTGLPRARGGSGDPSPFTALGVEAAMRASCQRVFGLDVAEGADGRGDRRGARRLARSRSLVSKAGAKVLLADIDESKQGGSRRT